MHYLCTLSSTYSDGYSLHLSTTRNISLNWRRNVVKKGRRSIFYIRTKVENGGFKRFLFPLRAMRVAKHCRSHGEDCVTKSWGKSPAFLTRSLYTRQDLLEVGNHVLFV